MRVSLSRLVLAALVSVGAPVGAQPLDAAAAEVLFSEGRAAFERGDYETACEKLAESQRLDPAAGTLINLAACNERRGKLATAWEKWRQALRWLAADDERRPGVEQRVRELEKRLPRLEIALAADPPEGTRVKRGEVTLRPAALGLALPVDPGKQVVVVSAPGHQANRYVVRLAEGETKGLVVQPGERLPDAGPAPEPRQKQTASKANPAERDPIHQDSSAPTIGWVIAGAGVASITAGAITGLMALDKKSTMQDECDQRAGTYYCSATGLDAASAGGTLATVSTVTVGLGVAALAVGGALIWTSSSASDQAALGIFVTPQAGGLRGKF